MQYKLQRRSKKKDLILTGKKVDVDGENIKELGNYIAKVHLYRDIKAELKFEVYAE